MRITSHSAEYAPICFQATRRQAIIWTNDGLFIDAYMRHSASISDMWFEKVSNIHYDDVIMSAIASQNASLTIVYSIVQIKENIKAPRHWPLWGEFTGDRWIPRTNGQLRGNCFHLMTSSWYLLMQALPPITRSSQALQFCGSACLFMF